jgi:hypothetical protein
VTEEQDDEEAAKVAQLAEYKRRQRLIATSDDPEDCPGLHAVFLASMNDKDACRGDVNAAITMSIRDAGMPLVDLTNDDEAGPSGAVKDEPTDKAGERGKKDVIHDGMDNFHQYHDSPGRRKYHDSKDRPCLSLAAKSVPPYMCYVYIFVPWLSTDPWSRYMRDAKVYILFPCTFLYHV